MSRRRASGPCCTTRSTERRSVRITLLWLLALVPFAAAAQEIEVEDTIELSAPVLQTLSKLQDEWLVWNSAFLQADERAAAAAVDDMLASAAQLGFERVSDLHHGVVLSAVEAAREGSGDKARWALDMAERLDPGRPETDFARGRIAWLEGRYPSSLVAHTRGLFQTLRDRRLGRILVYNLQIWLLASLMLTSAGFVALQMATKGPHLYREVVNWLSRLVPRVVALVIAAAFLVWPFLLPRGWILVVLFWAALLWGYGSSSERWAMAAALLVLGLAPIFVRVQQPGLQMALSAEQRAIDSITEERLYGKLFEDLAKVRDRLPESVAAKHLLADVHVMLGQREVARPKYSEVADAEPENGAALNNLGIFHMMRNEHARAIPFFEKASEIESSRLASSYNLSQIFSEMLEITNSEEQLAVARRVDAGAVSDWIAEQRRFVPLEGGFARLGEIRAELRAAIVPEGALSGWQSWARSVLLPFATIALGVLLQLFRSRSGAWRGLQTEAGGWLGKAFEWLVPGYVSAEAGDGGRAFFALLVPVTALVLPLSGLLSYRVPWAFDPGQALVWVAAGTVLVVFFALRWWRG